jgi:uncharacterized protein DUF4350
MRQRLTIILTVVVIIGVLAIVNSISLVKKDESQDFEITPNRSTYHSGPTGLRALHDFLNESGHKVIRWRDTPQKLLGDSGKLVTTFVCVGQIRVPFTDEEIKALNGWVARGGRFVLIDRQLDNELVTKIQGWAISQQGVDFPTIDTDPGNTKQMTEKAEPLAPVQPTVLTNNIQSVQPSRFAAKLRVVPAVYDPKEEHSDEEPKFTTSSSAPVVHIADKNGALLLEYNYGLGNVVILGDPYIVANGGIKLGDNLQLATNILTARGGLIAFDEYHQGKGVSGNAFATYFAGTPVLALAAQIGFLVLLILWTKARRFGRPLPLAQVDRRSSLEFVASMAELQERSRAFDLAIENIYTRTRRVLARHAGLDYNSSRSEIARQIAARSSIDGHRLETLMRQCEEVINGGPVTWRQSIELVRRLRQVERDLGLRMRSREIRQAAENI